MAAAAQTKRKGFDVTCCARPKAVPAKFPRVSTLTQASGEPVPSEAVKHKLGATQLCMGIDVETNDFTNGRKPYCVGRFGHGCWCSGDDLEFRLVQIGWVTSTCAAETEVDIQSKAERLIKPDAFTISEKATKRHEITNERAASNGLPLLEVLEEFMCEAWSLYEKGGVVVSHHLEFDAGIIDEELKRCGMESWRARWKLIASHGICTLDLDIQAWFQSAFGNLQSKGEKTLVMSLANSISLFYPKDPKIRKLLQTAHTAGADAELHIWLLHALRVLASRAMHSSDHSLCSV